MDKDTIRRIIVEELDTFSPTISVERMAVRISEMLPGPLMDSGDLDYGAEPPDGRTFSKESVRHYCLRAYENGIEDAFVSCLRHMAMHDDLTEAAACLGSFIEQEFRLQGHLRRVSGTGSTVRARPGGPTSHGEHASDTVVKPEPPLPCALCEAIPCKCEVLSV